MLYTSLIHLFLIWVFLTECFASLNPALGVSWYRLAWKNECCLVAENCPFTGPMESGDCVISIAGICRTRSQWKESESFRQRNVKDLKFILTMHVCMQFNISTNFVCFPKYINEKANRWRHLLKQLPREHLDHAPLSARSQRCNSHIIQYKGAHFYLNVTLGPHVWLNYLKGSNILNLYFYLY